MIQSITSPWFLMMVGLPGSGKSTFVSKISNPAIFDLLSTDLYIEDMALNDGITYNEAFPKYIDAAQKNFNENLRSSIEEGVNIVHDQTNLSIKKRKKILDQVPNSYWKVCVYVRTFDSFLGDRLMNRPGKIIPSHVMEQMQKSLELPTVQEGFDAIEWYESRND